MCSVPLQSLPSISYIFFIQALQEVYALFSSVPFSFNLLKLLLSSIYSSFLCSLCVIFLCTPFFQSPNSSSAIYVVYALFSSVRFSFSLLNLLPSVYASSLGSFCVIFIRGPCFQYLKSSSAIHLLMLSRQFNRYFSLSILPSVSNIH